MDQIDFSRRYLRRVKTKKPSKFNLEIMNKFLGILIVLGVIYYVVGVNDMVVKGFRLQELKREYASLESENRDYSTSATSLKSYNNLVKRVEKLDMVRAEKIDYLTGKMNTVAVR